MNAGDYLKEFDLTIDAPILSGQKIAKVNIPKMVQYSNMELLLVLQTLILLKVKY